MNSTQTKVSTALAPEVHTKSHRIQKVFAWIRPWFCAVPFGLRCDNLYLWTTFRIRYRPLKMMMLLVFLGALCLVWQRLGTKFILPKISTKISLLKPGDFQTTLSMASGAFFSSLNFLSCVTIVIMAWTLRRLLKQGHLESLMLVPARIRPSALFYGVATRYLPLAFVALLVIYVDPDPRYDPFQKFPFKIPQGQDAPVSLAPLFWAGARELSIFAFCPVNLFMDLSLAFWIFCRWRVTHVTTILAVLIIGLITPIFLMRVHVEAQQYMLAHLWRGTGVFQYFPDSIYIPKDFNTRDNIATVMHYTIVTIISGMIAMLALGHLDARWAKILRSEKIDPILIKPID